MTRASGTAPGERLLRGQPHAAPPSGASASRSGGGGVSTRRRVRQADLRSREWLREHGAAAAEEGG